MLERLFERWTHHGDRGARERIIEQFMPLARNLALRYSHSSEPLEDLTQVAALALVKAVDRFEPGRGSQFASYAIPTILGELRRYFRDSGWAVHVPRRDQELAQAIGAAEQLILAEQGRAPTAQQLAEHLGRNIEEVIVGLQARGAYTTRPLEAIEQDDGEVALRDTLGGPDPAYGRVEQRMTLAAVLSDLSDQDAELLRMRFSEGLSQTQIAARVGVSQMQVSRLLRRCFEGLRNSIDETQANGERRAA